MPTPVGTNVRVYWNFHRKLFSVQTKVNGRWLVTDHVKSLYLENATFHVSQAGRERVLRERKKNVHAKIYGTVCDYKYVAKQTAFVGYNPYYLNSFYAYRDQIEKTTSQEVVRSADYLILNVSHCPVHPSIIAKGFK